MKTFAMTAPALETRILYAASGWARRAGIDGWMRLVSRLGDGPGWFAAAGICCLVGKRPADRTFRSHATSGMIAVSDGGDHEASEG